MLDCGVIVALSVVSAHDVVVLLTCVDVVPVTTWRIRNAPRKPFISAAVLSYPTENDGGRFVGVAIVSIYTKKRADILPFRKQLIVFIECLIQPFFCSRNLFQLKQDHLKELILRMGLRSFHIEF